MERVQHFPPGPARGLSGFTVAGAVLSSLLAAVCCIGPLLLAVLGIGGAGFLAGFEVYRPIFTVTTFTLLGTGFWLAYRKPKAVANDACSCEDPKANKISHALLWIAAGVAVALWASPYLLGHLFR